MQWQVVSWVRDRDGLAELSPSGETVTGVSFEQMKQMEFPADHVCPDEFTAKLKRIYDQEHGAEGRSPFRVLTHPCVKLQNGTYPVTVLLIFQRKGGQWERTFGHLFVLAPTWWLELRPCCKRMVERFALLLSAATGKPA